MNYLAGVLDDFNNNTIGCGGALTLPNPGVAPGAGFAYSP